MPQKISISLTDSTADKNTIGTYDPLTKTLEVNIDTSTPAIDSITIDPGYRLNITSDEELSSITINEITNKGTLSFGTYSIGKFLYDGKCNDIECLSLSILDNAELNLYGNFYLSSILQEASATASVNVAGYAILTCGLFNTKFPITCSEYGNLSGYIINNSIIDLTYSCAQLFRNSVFNVSKIYLPTSRVLQYCLSFDADFSYILPYGENLSKIHYHKYYPETSKGMIEIKAHDFGTKSKEDYFEEFLGMRFRPYSVYHVEYIQEILKDFDESWKHEFIEIDDKLTLYDLSKIIHINRRHNTLKISESQDLDKEISDNANVEFGIILDGCDITIKENGYLRLNKFIKGNGKIIIEEGGTLESKGSYIGVPVINRGGKFVMTKKVAEVVWDDPLFGGD